MSWGKARGVSIAIEYARPRLDRKGLSFHYLNGYRTYLQGSRRAFFTLGPRQDPWLPLCECRKTQIRA